MKRLMSILSFFLLISCESVNEPNSFILTKNIHQNVNGNEIIYLGLFEENRIEPNHLLRFDHYADFRINGEYYHYRLDQQYYCTNEFCFQIINISNNKITIQF